LILARINNSETGQEGPNNESFCTVVEPRNQTDHVLVEEYADANGTVRFNPKSSGEFRIRAYAPSETYYCAYCGG
jgi:hypothetical protein